MGLIYPWNSISGWIPFNSISNWLESEKTDVNTYTSFCKVVARLLVSDIKSHKYFYFFCRRTTLTPRRVFNPCFSFPLAWKVVISITRAPKKVSQKCSDTQWIQQQKIRLFEEAWKIDMVFWSVKDLFRLCDCRSPSLETKEDGNWIFEDLCLKAGGKWMIFPALSKVTLLLRNSEKMGHFPQSFLKDAEERRPFQG